MSGKSCSLFFPFRSATNVLSACESSKRETMATHSNAMASAQETPKRALLIISEGGNRNSPSSPCVLELKTKASSRENEACHYP